MRISVIAATVFVAALVISCQEYAPAGDNIRTEWAEKVTPRNVHPEYPRPQLIRSEWKNLNGLWDYSIRPGEGYQTDTTGGKILVPFCIESSLSGVCRTLDPRDTLLYERSFRVPAKWKSGGRKVILHFGAVDWEAIVSLNGREIGRHTGGYTSFEFDITRFLKRGRQTLEVKVVDATSSKNFQPRGKQVNVPSGVFYTSVTGIWQTVWMESVPNTHVNDYLVNADIDNGDLDMFVAADNCKRGDKLKVRILDGKDVVAEAVSDYPWPLHTNMQNMHLWSPDDPYLYDVEVSVERDGKTIDCVKGYTAMRKISVKEDADGHKRLALNNKILFQYGPLDQGWWPDGLYTAPSDEAMRYDLLKTKEYGFNMIRKHVKVEPDTWYRACDELGILVWQDMPHFAIHEDCVWGRKDNKYDTGTDFPATKEQKRNFYSEWSAIIAQHRKFPCIVVWVPFNEAWGQFDTGYTVDYTRRLDPTRLVNGASGGNWFKGQMGDMIDSHNYPNPFIRVWDPELVVVLGEYGGIGLPVEGHVWNIDRKWGYVKYETTDQLTNEYVNFAGQLEDLTRQGCAAAVYTQTTDVEGEVNGLMTYDRKVLKIDAQRAAVANKAVIDITRE